MVVASVGVQRLVISSNRSDLILDPGRWVGRSEEVGFPFGPLRISGFGWHRIRVPYLGYKLRRCPAIGSYIIRYDVAALCSTVHSYAGSLLLSCAIDVRSSR